MSLLYLLLAGLAALAFYLTSPHQRLVPRLRDRRRALRWVAWTCTLLSTGVACGAFGVWSGVFAALSALMLGLVVLPYADAWWQIRKEKIHVG